MRDRAVRPLLRKGDDGARGVGALVDDGVRYVAGYILCYKPSSRVVS